jgi:hypothetical protein
VLKYTDALDFELNFCKIRLLNFVMKCPHWTRLFLTSFSCRAAKAKGSTTNVPGPLTSRIMEVDDVTTLNTFSVLDNGSRTIFFFLKRRKRDTSGRSSRFWNSVGTMERTEKNEQAGEVARYGP